VFHNVRRQYNRLSVLFLPNTQQHINTPWLAAPIQNCNTVYIQKPVDHAAASDDASKKTALIVNAFLRPILKLKLNDNKELTRNIIDLLEPVLTDANELSLF